MRRSTLYSQLLGLAVRFHLLQLQKSEHFSQTDSSGTVRSGWPWPALGCLSPAPEILGLRFSLPMKRAVLLLMEKSCPSPQSTGAEILIVPLKFIASKDGSQTKAVTTTRPAWPWAAPHLLLQRWEHVFLPNERQIWVFLLPRLGPQSPNLGFTPGIAPRPQSHGLQTPKLPAGESMTRKNKAESSNLQLRLIPQRVTHNHNHNHGG